MSKQRSAQLPVFDPAGHEGNPDAKIVAALERIGQATRVLLWKSGAEEVEPGALSPIQIQTLVFLNYHAPGLARVGELAREFALTSATVSDAVSALERKGLLEKAPFAKDRRQFVLELTSAGKRAARRLADWAAPLEIALKDVAEDDKAVVLRVLLGTIAQLQDQGVVQSTRMCLTCLHFRPDTRPHSDTPHYCALLDRPLAAGDLRIDCAEHAPAA